MEEGTPSKQEMTVGEVVQDKQNDPIAVKEADGEYNQQKTEVKKEDEETTFDGEFIKVEKEFIETKSCSHAADEKAVEIQSEPSVIQTGTCNSSVGRGLLEAEKRMNELELDLERIAGSLKQSELENSCLKNEVSLSEEKLMDNGKKYEELELNHKKLKEHITETEERYQAHLSAIQDALRAEEIKYSELINVKEAFDNLNFEHNSSQKKIQELEQQLQTCAGEAQKFQELHKQSDSQAESEKKKASEFERLLELTKMSAKEMEDQMASLQNELKSLHEKIAENQKIEEALKCAAAELLTVQGHLDLSNSRIVEMEHRLASKEVLMKELTQELDLRKASESQMKEDIFALRELLSSTKEDLQAKVFELEETKVKLQQEIMAKEHMEVGFRDHQAQFAMINEELADVTKEKQSLEAALVNMTANATHMKELCSDLEAKLQLSDENFCKADSLSSQALANCAELEQKLKTLEELHHESGYALTIANQKNLELEEILRSSNVAAEESNSHHEELQKRFATVEERNVELEQQLHLIELKSSNSDSELSELSKKVTELNTALSNSLEEKRQLDLQVQEDQDKITKLENELNKSSARNLELEIELKTLSDKLYEHEERTHGYHTRGLELEDLLQISRSKVEDSGKRAGDLELLLVAERNKIQELENQINMLDKKCGDLEAESKRHLGTVSELEAELEAFKTKASILEVAHEMANEKEKKLTTSLMITTEEKKSLEDSYKSTSEKLSEAENILEILRNELNCTQQRVENIESDLRASEMKEREVMEKLRYTEQQLEQERKVQEIAITRNLELESLHESLIRDYDLRLQDVSAKLNSRDCDAKLLLKKLEILEDQVKVYEEQIAEAARKSASVKEELVQISVKLASSEFTNEEFKRQMMEAEEKVAQTLSENELLVDANTNLKNKVNELQELLNSACVEKTAINEQLASHVTTIAELREQNSVASEVQLKAECRFSESERQLEDAIQKLSGRDSEVKYLNEKLYALQSQLKTYEEEQHETSALAENQKLELNLTLERLKDLDNSTAELQNRFFHLEKQREELAAVNMKLTQELASCESRLNELQAKFCTTCSEKDEAIEQLLSSKKEIENLTQQLTSEEQRLQMQLSSVIEENNMLNEKYLNSKEELQSLISHLEEQVKHHKSNEEALKTQLEVLQTEICQKSVLQNCIDELEEKLVLAESRLNKEVESVRFTFIERERELTSKLDDYAVEVQDRHKLSEQVTQLQRELLSAQTTIDELQKVKVGHSRKEVEQDTFLKHTTDELEVRNKEIALLGEQVKALEQKLLLAEAKTTEKDVGSNPKEEKIETEVRSREIGNDISTLSRRKTKKKIETASMQGSSSAVGMNAQTTDVSHVATFKFIIGVALVSVIIGIILGKRY